MLSFDPIQKYKNQSTNSKEIQKKAEDIASRYLTESVKTFSTVSK